jgi:hypothetical protein
VWVLWVGGGGGGRGLIGGFKEGRGGGRGIANSGVAGMATLWYTMLCSHVQYQDGRARVIESKCAQN